MAAKEATTLSINPKVKKDFKMECLRNDNEMSEVVENFMLTYIKLSKDMHDDLLNKKE